MLSFDKARRCRPGALKPLMFYAEDEDHDVADRTIFTCNGFVKSKLNCFTDNFSYTIANNAYCAEDLMKYLTTVKMYSGKCACNLTRDHKLLCVLVNAMLEYRRRVKLNSLIQLAKMFRLDATPAIVHAPSEKYCSKCSMYSCIMAAKMSSSVEDLSALLLSRVMKWAPKRPFRTDEFVQFVKSCALYKNERPVPQILAMLLKNCSHTFELDRTDFYKTSSASYKLRSQYAFARLWYQCANKNFVSNELVQVLLRICVKRRLYFLFTVITRCLLPPTRSLQREALYVVLNNPDDFELDVFDTLLNANVVGPQKWSSKQCAEMCRLINYAHKVLLQSYRANKLYFNINSFVYKACKQKIGVKRIKY
jgi:hypothetical protein